MHRQLQNKHQQVHLAYLSVHRSNPALTQKKSMVVFAVNLRAAKNNIL